MFPNVEVRHLHAVVVLAEEMNFTRAAHRLNVTQPALSKQITELEEQFGLYLFNREKGRLIGTWNYLYYDQGKRRSRLIGNRQQYPTKATAWKAAEAFRSSLQPTNRSTAPTVQTLVNQFREEKMPKRYSTRLAYESWFRNHILLAWGNRCITDLQARPVELWLDGLNLSPKSRVHIRTLIRELWDLAMWAGHVPVERNPMELVKVRGATKRDAQAPKPHSRRVPKVRAAP